MQVGLKKVPPSCRTVLILQYPFTPKTLTQMDNVILLVQFGGFFNAIFIAIIALLASYLLPDIKVDSFWSALVFAVVVSLVNWALGGFLNRLVSPLGFLPFRAAYLLVDAVIIYLADFFIRGFRVKNFYTALILAIILTAAQWIF